ncbi:MAG: hypothetical protein AAB584_01980 [Patescibacteria group bacterium]
MNKKYSFSPIGLIVLMTAVLISLAAVFSYVEAELAEGVTQEQIDAALQDLSEVYGQTVTHEQAKEICSQDKYAADCAEIGKRHNLFEKKRLAQVDIILDEIKGQVADQIKNCQNIECLVGVAQSLATKISRENPSLASQIDLTPTIVREKKEIVELAKSAGLTIDQCIDMDPDTAPVEVLRGCAKLSKENKVRKYVPTEARAQIDAIGDSTERTVQFKEALSSGKYQCGDNTVSGCGNFCLNPGAEARASGTSAIPEVCKNIASDFFGSKGVRELENSYNRVSGVADYYYKKAQNFVFTTLDGRTLSSPDQIGQYMEAEGKAGNVEAISKGMDFMVSQGFATQADKDFAVKMVGKFREKGGVNNFDVCVQDPKACRDFINDDFQNDFDVMDQVFEIMRAEIGFNPNLCEQGALDQSIGLKCLEGGKRALPKIEALAATNPEVRLIVEEIKSHLNRGDQLAQKRSEFTSGTFTGPGGCKNERECFVYCSNPVNGPECISFGSKEKLSGFTGDEAVIKYQQYEYTLKRPAIEEQNITSGQPVYGPYGDAVYQPGGQPPYGPSSYGPSSYRPSYYQPYPPYPPYPPGPQAPGTPGIQGPQGFGPSPECLRAITSGDFASAKQFCDVGIGGPQPFPTNPPICPASPYIECPAGQYHESFRNENGCWVDGPCKPIPTYSPYPTYPGPYPTGPGAKPQCSDGIDNDNDGQTDFPADPSCYGPEDWDEYYPVSGGKPDYTPGPGGMQKCFYPNASKDGKPLGYTVWCEADYVNCHEGSPSGAAVSTSGLSLGAPNNCEGGWPQPSYTPWPSYSPGPGGSSCSPSLISLLGTGCHQMYTDSTGRQVYCDGPMTKSAKEGDSAASPGCSGGGPVWTPYPSGWEGQYPGQCSDGVDNDADGLIDSADTSCATSPPIGVGNCPAGYHYHGEQGGFCMNDREDYAGTCYSADGKSAIKCPAYSSPQTCPSGQWWDPARGYCVGSTSPSPYPSPGAFGCPAGYHSHSDSGGYCMNDREDYAGTCYSSDGKTTIKCPAYSSPQTCPSGQWWDYARSACVSSTGTYSPYPTYSSPTSSGSCPSGSHIMYVNNAGGYCMSDADSTKCGPLNSSSTSSFGSCSSYQSTATTYTPVPSCPSGQWWDYTTNSCKSSTAGSYTPVPSCPSGQWWDYAKNACSGSVTYTPAPYSCSSGWYWDQASNSCRQSSTSPTYTPYSGYCGDAVCSSSESSSSCPSDCGSGTATTYTPYPTTAYTPYPSCPSGQWWDSATNSCQGSTTTYTPYPTTEYSPPPSTYSPPPESSPTPPPPTSGVLYNHFASLHCAGLDRVWDGKYCQPEGFLARTIENTWANFGKLLGF